MTRSLAPPPDAAVFSYLCNRCDCEFEDYGIVSECLSCRVASLLVYGQPIRGELSGS